VQATWFEMEWADQERAELQRIKLEWAELQQAELRRIESLIPELEVVDLLLPEIKQAEVDKWVDLEAHIAPILDVSKRHVVMLRQTPEIERAREVSKHLAWKFRERLARMESDTTHPLNPAIQALISIAKVPARGMAPLQQALVGVAKAASHVLLALLA
jgi:hypothetical protein